MLASRFVWEAAGSPPFVETDGTPVRPRFTSPTNPGSCASCFSEIAPFHMSDVISEKFTTIRNNGILWPFGGERVCQSCAWVFKTLALRCAVAFARRTDEHGPGGIWFVSLRPIPRPVDWPKNRVWPFTKPDVLEVLLNPPPPPFVAWCPLYGINHGGESHVDRCYWPGAAPRPRGLLKKLQTKHTVPYAKVSHDRARYDLAIDEWNTTVDVALWKELRAHAMGLLRELRRAGVGAENARRALTTLKPPLGAPLSLIAPASWRATCAPFSPHISSPWWGFFVDLLPMPALA